MSPPLYREVFYRELLYREPLYREPFSGRGRFEARPDGRRAPRLFRGWRTCPLWGGDPELLYLKFTSKDQTLILTQVLKVKREVPRFY